MTEGCSIIKMAVSYRSSYIAPTFFILNKKESGRLGLFYFSYLDTAHKIAWLCYTEAMRAKNLKTLQKRLEALYVNIAEQRIGEMQEELGLKE